MRPFNRLPIDLRPHLLVQRMTLPVIREKPKSKSGWNSLEQRVRKAREAERQLKATPDFESIAIRHIAIMNTAYHYFEGGRWDEGMRELRNAIQESQTLAVKTERSIEKDFDPDFEVRHVKKMLEGLGLKEAV